jgi:1-acyl-sn-glycerol-3-phosphate acyltransferase
VQAVRDGECVGIYPEATLTRDPGLWPMVGKTGAARVALETGAPVVPIAQWGPQQLLPPYGKRPKLFPRATMHVWAGPPVDLAEFQGRPIDGPLLREVTERIMAAITELLEEIRGEQAPAVRFDVRSTELPRTGDPRRPRSAS